MAPAARRGAGRRGDVHCAHSRVRSLPIRLPLSVLLLSIASLAHAGDARTYGEPIPADAVAVPISVAAADVDAHAGEPRRFSGRITGVCQKEGCWLMLEDDGQAARVMMRDHAFAVPGDASGHAEVYGVLSLKQLTPEAARHLAGDAGGDAPPPERELRIQATGVRIGG